MTSKWLERKPHEDTIVGQVANDLARRHRQLHGHMDDVYPSVKRSKKRKTFSGTFNVQQELNAAK